jgi:spore germination cell wall hydrolase CwlJ-like protein
MGQYAVALVTLNRAKNDKGKVCQEVFKRKQFSWANHGVTKVGTGWKLSAGLNPKDAHAWWVAQRIAATTLAGRMPDFTRGAQFYHANRVKPVWRLAMVQTKVIGNHRFYCLPVRQS